MVPLVAYIVLLWAAYTSYCVTYTRCHSGQLIQVVTMAAYTRCYCRQLIQGVTVAAYTRRHRERLTQGAIILLKLTKKKLLLWAGYTSCYSGKLTQSVTVCQSVTVSSLHKIRQLIFCYSMFIQESYQLIDM